MQKNGTVEGIWKLREFFFLNVGDVIILMMSKYTSETKDTREKRITGATRE